MKVVSLFASSMQRSSSKPSRVIGASVREMVHIFAFSSGWYVQYIFTLHLRNRRRDRRPPFTMPVMCSKIKTFRAFLSENTPGCRLGVFSYVFRFGLLRDSDVVAHGKRNP